jgi:hypothetical protein
MKETSPSSCASREAKILRLVVSDWCLDWVFLFAPTRVHILAVAGGGTDFKTPVVATGEDEGGSSVRCTVECHVHELFHPPRRYPQAQDLPPKPCIPRVLEKTHDFALQLSPAA